MIGLEVIIKTFNKSSSEVAKNIGISRQTLNDWIKGRSNIPKKRLKQLSKMFNLPEEYFQKELKGSEKLIIQKSFIDQNATFETIEYKDYDDEGNEIIIQEEYCEDKIISSFFNEEIEKEKILEETEELLLKDKHCSKDNHEFFKRINWILSKGNYKQKEMLSDVLIFLLYRQDGWGGFFNLDKEVKDGLEKIYNKYNKD